MTLEKAFKIAEKKKIAIGHFNVSNLETFEAVVRAGKHAKMPVIIGVSEGAIHHAGLNFFIWAKNYFKKKYRSDFFLHLDHGRNLNLIQKTIDSGFDSVMIDASHEDFKKNVYLARKVVGWAKKKNVWVEAEIGKIGGAEENVSARKIVFTDPLMAKEFVDKTGCNSLAISIGTSHGPNKFLKKSKLNFNVLKDIKRLVKVPLVLHGASSVDQKVIKELKKQGVKIGHPVGVSEKDISDSIRNGIRKINTDTDLNLVAVDDFMKAAKQKNQEIKLYKILDKAMEAVEKEVMGKIKLFSKK